MNPSKQRTFYTKFVFSLKAILPDLEDDVHFLKEELASQGHQVDCQAIVASWVMFQLERHLHLHLLVEGQYASIYYLRTLIPLPFYHKHTNARDLLLSQIRPTLTYRETVPYTDRSCSAEVRLPDLHLHFQ